MAIYIYRANDGRTPDLLGWLTGCRYVAYDRQWPWGRRLAFGSTIRGVTRRAQREAGRRARPVPLDPRPVVAIFDGPDDRPTVSPRPEALASAESWRKRMGR